jgi:hypothetical protein
MNTLIEVRDALVVALRTIKTTNGYLNDIPEDHVIGHFDSRFLDNYADDAYPKCLVFPSEGVSQAQIGQQWFKTAEFTILIVVKIPEIVPGESASNTAIMSYLEDIEKMLDMNHNLGGNVTLMGDIKWTVDSGALAEEAVLAVQIRSERY